VYASRLQNFAVWITLFALPTQLLAQDAGAAMLYGDDVSVNNSVIPKSIAIFPGDVLATKGASATVVDTGSSATVTADSLIDYQKNNLRLEHGDLAVTTSVGMSVRVGCVVVTPADEVTTKFEVRDLDGKIIIDAQKGDLIISENKQHEKLLEGQEGTRRDEKCRAGAGAESAANQGILDSKTAKIVGSGIVGGVLLWLLIDESGTPLSSWQP
jgi:hypothetical protein